MPACDRAHSHQILVWGLLAIVPVHTTTHHTARPHQHEQLEDHITGTLCPGNAKGRGPEYHRIILHATALPEFDKDGRCH